MNRHVLACVVFTTCIALADASAQELGTLQVVVRSDTGPVAGAQVSVGSMTVVTAGDGTAYLSLPAGRVDVVITRSGFDPAAAPVEVLAGVPTRVEIEMRPQSEIEETIIVSATRT